MSFSYVRAICGLSLLLVLALLSSTETNISKFQFDQDKGPAWKPAKADMVSSLNIVIYLFIYFLLVF